MTSECPKEMDDSFYNVVNELMFAFCKSNSSPEVMAQVERLFRNLVNIHFRDISKARNDAFEDMDKVNLQNKRLETLLSVMGEKLAMAQNAKENVMPPDLNTDDLPEYPKSIDPNVMLIMRLTRENESLRNKQVLMNQDVHTLNQALQRNNESLRNQNRSLLEKFKRGKEKWDMFSRKIHDKRIMRIGDSKQDHSDSGEPPRKRLKSPAAFEKRARVDSYGEGSSSAPKERTQRDDTALKERTRRDDSAKHRSDETNREHSVKPRKAEVNREHSLKHKNDVSHREQSFQHKREEVILVSSDNIEPRRPLDPTPQVAGEKYSEVIRNREERRKLHGVACPCCKDYYEAIGPVPQILDLGQPARDSEHVNNISRHRYKWLPPSTPPGFWDVEFPNTSDVDEQNKHKKQKQRQK
ncbi:hypothetical protein BC829DRAFT_394854 [Chytridium lagenaria]|nr:hypothetical protein BC829DRAFT_394854 [Chytridium lagenaria]